VGGARPPRARSPLLPNRTSEGAGEALRCNRRGGGREGPPEERERSSDSCYYPGSRCIMASSRGGPAPPLEQGRERRGSRRKRGTTAVSRGAHEVDSAPRWRGWVWPAPPMPQNAPDMPLAGLGSRGRGWILTPTVEPVLLLAHCPCSTTARSSRAAAPCSTHCRRGREGARGGAVSSPWTS
jgi:hypothetical protein